MSNLSDYTVSGGGVKPPKPAANNLIGSTDLNSAAYLPMQVTTSGEYLEVSSTGVEHFDENAVSIWGPVTYASILASSVLASIYWDKVDNKLYIIVNYAAGLTSQLASINTLTGAVTLIGGTFAATTLDAATKPGGVSIQRSSQGTGNLLVSVSNTTGNGSFELNVSTGAKTSEISNITIGGVNPSVIAPYKVDSDLFIGGITAPLEYAYPNTVSNYINTKSYLALATPLRHTKYAQINTNDGSYIGTVDTTGSAIAGNIIDWGGDVAIWSRPSTQRRSGPALYDRVDFHRFAIDVAKANGAR